MARSRHCDACGEWHDLNEAWPRKCYSHFKRFDESNTKSSQVMGDIQPYKNVVDGKVIGGRKQHRDFLRSRGLVEVGNESVTQKYVEPPPVAHDLKRALDELGWRG